MSWWLFESSEPQARRPKARQIDIRLKPKFEKWIRPNIRNFSKRIA